MKNNSAKKVLVSIEDRIVSTLAYVTCGIFSLIWIIFANVSNRRITPFLSFNMYQAIFFSVALAAISFVYSIALNILFIIPFVGKLAKDFDVFFNSTPLVHDFTISGFIVMVVIAYLAVLSLVGRRPYLPIISNMINANFGG